MATSVQGSRTQEQGPSLIEQRSAIAAHRLVHALYPQSSSVSRGSFYDTICNFELPDDVEIAGTTATFEVEPDRLKLTMVSSSGFGRVVVLNGRLEAEIGLTERDPRASFSCNITDGIEPLQLQECKVGTILEEDLAILDRILKAVPKLRGTVLNSPLGANLREQLRSYALPV